MFLLGCTSGSTGSSNNRGYEIEADGRYAFYSGKGVGDTLSSGGAIDDATYPTGFMRLRVPNAFVDEGLAKPTRVLTASFEVADNSIEATVHWTVHDTPGAPGRLETRYFHPGDPWVSGYAQVGVGTEGITVGLFEVIKWNRDSSGTMPNAFSQEIHTTGLLPDDDKPPLKYADNLNSTPLPDNWK